MPSLPHDPSWVRLISPDEVRAAQEHALGRIRKFEPWTDPSKPRSPFRPADDKAGQAAREAVQGLSTDPN